MANQLCQYGYFFPVSDTKNLTVKDDSSLYRFQVSMKLNKLFLLFNRNLIKFNTNKILIKKGNSRTGYNIFIHLPNFNLVRELIEKFELDIKKLSTLVTNSIELYLQFDLNFFTFIKLVQIVFFIFYILVRRHLLIYLNFRNSIC